MSRRIMSPAVGVLLLAALTACTPGGASDDAAGTPTPTGEPSVFTSPAPEIGDPHALMAGLVDDGDGDVAGLRIAPWGVAVVARDSSGEWTQVTRFHHPDAPDEHVILTGEYVASDVDLLDPAALLGMLEELGCAARIGVAEAEALPSGLVLRHAHCGEEMARDHTAQLLDGTAPEPLTGALDAESVRTAFTVARTVHGDTFSGVRIAVGPEGDREALTVTTGSMRQEYADLDRPGGRCQIEAELGHSPLPLVVRHPCQTRDLALLAPSVAQPAAEVDGVVDGLVSGLDETGLAFEDIEELTLVHHDTEQAWYATAVTGWAADGGEITESFYI